VEQVGPAIEVDDKRPEEDAGGLVEGEERQGKGYFEQGVAYDDDEKCDLSDEIAGEDAFEIEMGLLDGFEMREQDHAEQARDEPFQHVGKVGAGVQPIADPIGEKQDQQDAGDGDGGVDKEGSGGDRGSFCFICARADVADVCVFEQSALGEFESGRYDEEEGPGSHLGFGEGADEHDETDQAEESSREALEYREKCRTDPIRRQIFFQFLLYYPLIRGGVKHTRKNWHLIGPKKHVNSLTGCVWRLLCVAKLVLT
jgi:hypothetical protein